MDEDNFMRSMAAGLINMQSSLTGMIQNDHESGALPGQGMFANFIAPTNVTPSVKAQIAALPKSPDLILYLHIDLEFEHEGTSLMCCAHTIKKEHGSDGKPYADSDAFGLVLANSAMLDTLNNIHNAKIRVLLGTLAKACIEPMKGNGMMGASMAFLPPEMRPVPSRPKKVLFQTRGEVEMLRDELKEMGIDEVDVAEQSLIQSCEIQASSTDMPSPDGASMEEIMHDPRAMMAHRIIEQTEGPYVSEERVSLGGWSPPNEPGDFPLCWYARPPSDPTSYRPTTLCGWRTNLERAVLREDSDNVKRIVSKYNTNHVREYVECRMLLTKMAQRGMVNACRLLIVECGASVEGAQAPDAKGWWKGIQNNSGNYQDLTPLHQAARNGKLETVRLLLEHGANVNQIDRSEIRGSPLHHVVSMGEIDCVKLLCEHGADHTYAGFGGEALDISEMVVGGDVFKQRVQTKVDQILREYEARCSYCRKSDPLKQCPCKKERYCDASCQRRRWKLHKKYHNEIVGGT
mmetsp:Transcript_35099/g.71706  ORF Transcript_35099/g.71706 Transcript_35099/m.71706 type:complete len:518 (+) Transcript_35099:47-1600(+)